MQLEVLKSIVETIINKQVVPVIDLLYKKKNVNEFQIAKKLKLTINQTRNILYKLLDYGLVYSTRKKDKKKGWFIYFWTLDIQKSLNFLYENLKKQLENLETQLKLRKEKRYYFCKSCSVEVSEESALLNDFVCPYCESVYELSDNEKKIKELEKSISKIKEKINEVYSEIEKQSKKSEKKKIKIKKLKKDIKKRSTKKDKKRGKGTVKKKKR